MGKTETFKIINEVVSKVSGQAKIKAVASATGALKEKQNQLKAVMKKTKLGVNDASRALGNLGFKADKSGKYIDEMGKSFKMTRKNIKAARKSVQRFDMSNLSLMFGFMALGRATGQFLKSAMLSYNKANGENSELNKSTAELSAAWEFMKYSLVDALSQSGLFKMLVGWVLAAINAFNGLSETKKGIIMLGIGILFVASMLGMAVFQAKLFFGAIFTGSIVATGGVGTLQLAIEFLIGTIAQVGWAVFFTGLLISLIGVGLLVWGIIDIFRYWGKDTEKVIIGVIKVIAGLALIIIGLQIAFGGVLLAAGLMAAGIVLVIAGLAILIVKKWDDIKDGFEAMGVGIQIFWNKVVSFLIGKFMDFHVSVIEKVKNIVAAFAKIPMIGHAFKGPLRMLKSMVTTAKKVSSAVKGVYTAEGERLNDQLAAIVDRTAARNAISVESAPQQSIFEKYPALGAYKTAMSQQAGATTTSNTTIGDINIDFGDATGAAFDDLDALSNAVADKLADELNTANGSANL